MRQNSSGEISSDMMKAYGRAVHCSGLGGWGSNRGYAGAAGRSRAIGYRSRLKRAVRAILVRMSDAAYRHLTIRTALPKDAEGITRTYMESAEFHAGLDPERYALPDAQDILTRYREGRQQ